MAYGDQDFKKFNDNIKKCELKDFETILMKIFEQSNSKGGDRTSIEKFNFHQGLDLLSNALCRLVDEDLACIQKQTKKKWKKWKKMEKIKGNSLEVLSNYEKNKEYFENEIKEYFRILCDIFSKYSNYIYGVYITSNQLMEFVKKNEKEIYNDLKNMIHKLDDKELLSDDFFAPLQKEGSLYELNNEMNAGQQGTDYRKSPHAQMCSVLGLNDSQYLIGLANDFQAYFNILQELMKKIKLSNIKKEDDKDWIIFKKTVKLIKNECLNGKNKDFLSSYKKAAEKPIKKICEILDKYQIT